MGRVSIGLVLLLCVLFLTPLSAGASTSTTAGVIGSQSSAGLSAATAAQITTNLAIPDALQRARESKGLGAHPVPAVIVPSRDRRNDPDDAGYQYRDSDENDGPAYNWINIVDRDGAQSWRLGDDQTVQTRLGFEFTWYGNAYQDINLCSNGWVSFTYQGADYSYGGWDRVPNEGVPGNWISPLMSDWYMPSGGTLWFWTDESQAVITWEDVVHINNDGSSASWQAVLNADGMVTFNYRAFAFGENGNPGFLVGYQNADGSRGAEIARNEDYPTAEFSIGVGNNWEQFDGAAISVTPRALNFGDVYVGQTGTIAVTVQNIGEAELVITDVSCDVGAFILPDLGGQNLVLQPGERFATEVSFAPDEAAEYNGNILVDCNAVNGDENGNVVVSASGNGVTPPSVSIAPQAYDVDLNTGESRDLGITIANAQGAADLTWESEIVIVDEPERDDNARGLRGVDGGIAVPSRDDPPASRYLLICQRNGWGYDQTRVFTEFPGGGVDYDRISTPAEIDNLNLGDYDCIYMGNYESEAWVAEYNARRAVFEDWVDNGGAIYHANGTNNHNTRTINIGGFRYYWGEINGDQSQNPCILRVGPDDNFLMAWMQENDPIGGFDWVVDGQLAGNGCAHGVFSEDDIAAIDNSDWYQIMAVGAQVAQPTIVTYKFGRGFVLASTTVDGFLHNNPQGYQWGRTGAGILWYLDFLSNYTEWISMAPESGVVQGGSEEAVTVTLNAEGLAEGDYEADVHFATNDPNNQDVTVNVHMFVTGAADIAAEWGPGFPDVINFNAAFEDVFNGFAYSIPVQITNEGTADLNVDGIDFSSDVYSSPEEGGFGLSPGATVEITVVLNSANSGDNAAVMSIFSNDPDQGEYPINLIGVSGEPPIFQVDHGSIEDDLFTGETSDWPLRVTNVGEAQLRFTVETEVISEPERDENVRGLRSVDGRNAGPTRDPLEARFALFKEVGGWGDQMEAMWAANEVDIVQYNSGQMANFPIDDYDAIWIREYQSDQFNTNWNNNRARFEDWVDGGGVIYMSTATNNWGVAPVCVGGFTRTNQNVQNGTVAISNDPQADNYNYLAELTGWRGGEVLNGNSYLHSTYRAADFENIDNSDEYQVLTTAQNIGDAIGMAVYSYGRGWGIAAGSTDSYEYVNHAQQGQWGWALNFMPVYLDYLTNTSQWLVAAPEEGALNAEEWVDVVVTLDAAGLFTGDYVGEVRFFTNDPDANPFVVDVALHVTGAPDIQVGWADEDGFPDVVNWNARYADLFSGGPYDMTVTVSNEGTDDLNISDIYTDHQYFVVNDDEAVLGAGDSQVLTLTFEAPDDAPGEYNTTLHLTSDDPDSPNIEVALHADADLPPAIVVNPNVIEETLSTGMALTTQLNVANEGDAILRFTVESEIISEPGRDGSRRALRGVDGSNSGPVRDPGGQLVAQFNGPNAVNQYWSPVGYDMDEDIMYLSSYTNSTVVEYTHDNYANFREVRRFGLANPMDGAFYNGMLYIGSHGNQTITRFNLAGQAVGQINVGFTFYGIATDQENGLIMFRNSNGNNIDVFPLVDDGAALGGRIGTIGNFAQYVNNFMPYNLEWVSKHPDGQLWINNSTDQRIYQIAVNTDNWQATATVQSFPNGGSSQPYDAVTHDGHNLWIGGYANANFRIYEDGITEAYWLLFAPESGEVEGDGEMDIDVTLDASGLIGGNYEGALIFTTNDPDDPTVEVGVVLTVEEASDIEVKWPNAWGYPENNLDWNAAFADVYWGGPYEVVIQVKNTGVVDLEIFSVTSDDANGFFYPLNEGNESFVVGAGATRPDTLVFFADEAGDFNGTFTIENNSERMPVVTFTVHGHAFNPPDAVLSDTFYETDLFTGETEDFSFTLTNDGDADLRWTTEVVLTEPDRDDATRSLRSVDGSSVGPLRDPPGQLLGQFNGNNAAGNYSSCAGWDWDSEGMWVTNYSAQNAVRWGHDGNYQNFQEQRRIAPGGCMDGAWAKGLFYLPGWAQAAVNRYNEAGQNIGAINMPWGVYGMAADIENDHIFFINGNTQQIHVYDLNDDGNLGQQIGIIANHQQYHGNVPAYSMEWVSKHPNGQLWMTSYTDGRVHEIAVNEENWQCTGEAQAPLQVFPGADQPYCAVGHDGHNLWASGLNPANIRIYDDGVTEAYWYIYSPEGGTLESQQDEDIFVTLDATGLIGGQYTADLLFHSNDPEGDVAHQTVLNVTGIGDIEVTWDEAAGFPNNLNWNGVYQDLYARGPYPITVTLKNVGTEDLQITDIIGDDIFTTDWNPDNQDVLAVDAEIIIHAIFEAPQADDYEGTITIESTDPDEGQIDIPCHAECSNPPHIVLSAESLNVDDMRTGDVRDYELTVSNDGDAVLNWELDPEITQEPGRDDMGRSLRNVDGSDAGPVRDPAGALVAQFAGPNVANQYWSPVGYDMDNDLAFISSYSVSMITVWTHDNYANFREVRRFGTPNPMDGGFYNGQVYQCNLNNGMMLRRFDIAGNAQADINVGYQAYGVAFDKENGRCFIKEQGGAMPIHVYEMNGNVLGQQIGLIQNWAQFVNNNPNLYQLEWVSKHPDGQLWINNPNVGLFQVAVNEDNWNPIREVQRFNVATQQPYDAVAHDGHNMWVGGYANNNIRIYEDGVTEAYWLIWDEQDGTIDPDQSHAVAFHLNAVGALAGHYQAIVHFLSNDPVRQSPTPDVDFTVDMEVTGIPNIDVTPGGPEVVNGQQEAAANFGIVYYGYPESMTVRVTNVGTDDLEIFDVVSDNDDFSVNPDDYDEVIGVGAFINLPISWNPVVENGEGDVNATLSFSTNDPRYVDEDGGYPVSVTGNALVAPELVLESNLIEEDLDEGESQERMFNLENAGGSPLIWEAEVRNMQEPERDDNGRSLRSVDGSAVGPLRDPAGQLIGQFNGNNAAGNYSSCAGWDWDNEGMWVTNYSAQNAVRWGHDANYQNFPEQRRIAPGGCMDGAWTKGLFYLPGWAQAAVNRYNAAGQNIGAINMPWGVYGMAADVENSRIFFINGNTQQIHVYNVNDDGSLGQQIGIIANHQQYHGNQVAYSMEWVSKHPDGQLWMTNYTTGRVHQITVNEANWSCTGEAQQAFAVFPGADQPYCAVGHDGHNLWASGLNPANIRIYEDGVTEAYWLLIEPMDNTIGAGGSEDIAITFSTEGAIGGHYEADIVFLSNDPRDTDPDNDPRNVLTVTLDIHGISVWESDPQAMPLVQEANIEFDNTFVDGERPYTVTVANVGSEAFDISDVAIEGANPEDFATSFNGAVNVPTDEEVAFTFFFRPTETGQRSAVVIFTTDAMNIEGGDASWNVTGFAESGPDMYTRPADEVPMEYAAVGDDQPFNTTLVIGNGAGDNRADLVWSLYSEPVEGQRDAVVRGVRSVKTGEVGPLRDRRGEPDNATYEWRDNDEADGPDYEWVDIVNREGAQSWQMGDDDGRQVQMGFEFPYYGRNSSDLWICSNGWVATAQPDRGWVYSWQGMGNFPGANFNAGEINCAMSDWYMPRGGNTWFWSDANMAVITWNAVEHINGAGAWTFQTILYANGYGVFQYAETGAPDGTQLVGYQNWDRNGGANIAAASNGYLVEGRAIAFGPQDVWGIPWLTIDPTNGTVPQGEERELTLTYNHAGMEEGDYFGNIIIESNDADGPVMTLPVSFHKGDRPEPPGPVHFTPINVTGENHSLLITGISFDGDPVANDWEVGIFTPGGVLSGSARWFGEAVGPAVWGADEAYPDQFDAGETMNLRVWNPATDEEWNGRAVVEEGNMVWQANGYTVLAVEAFSAKTLDVAFRLGWNLISINVTPTDEGMWAGDPGPEIIPMMAQLQRPNNGAHHVILMKNERGAFYVPERGFNGIAYWNLAEGYQVRMDEAMSAQWVGVPKGAQDDVPISRGWNMIAYFPDYSLLASRASRNYVVSPIIDNVVIAKDGLGNFMIPSRDFFSNMPPWREGLGYQINVSADVVLNYPQAQNQAAALSVDPESVKGRWADVPSTGANMSVLVTKVSGVDLSTSDQVAAFSPSGLMVGVGRVIDGQIGIAVWGDDASTQAVDGLKDGEAFTLKLWNAAEDVVVDLSSRVIEGDRLVYLTDGFTVIDASVTTALPTEFYLSQNYPNPFNAVTRVAFGLPEASRVTVRVFDLSGREVSTLVSGELQAGHHSVVLDGESMVSGVYIVKMEATNFSAVRKVMLVK